MERRGSPGAVCLLGAALGAWMLSGCPVDVPNSAPSAGVTVTKTNLEFEETTTASCAAIDPDGDALEYTWTAVYGELSSESGEEVTYTAPQQEVTDTITCRVSDGQDGHTITVTETVDVYAPTLTVRNFVAQTGNSQLLLRWTNPRAPTFLLVDIRRSDSAYPDLPTDGVEVYSGTNESHIDTGLANGTKYFYTAFAQATDGSWGARTTASGTPSSDTTPPANPTNLSAQASAGKVVLSWGNPTDSDFAGTRLLRSTEAYAVDAYDGSQEQLFDLRTTTSYTDTEVGNDVTYYYSLFAADAAANYSEGGAKVMATPSEDGAAPADVSSFGATASDSSVSLSWGNPGDPDLAGVVIVRKAGSEPASLAEGTQVYDGTGTSCTDSGLSNGTTYYYRACAYDGSGNYAAGAVASATPATGLPTSYSMALVSTFNSPDTQPLGIAWDGTSLWVSGAANDSYYRIDPTTGEVLESHDCGLGIYEGSYGSYGWYSLYGAITFSDSTAYVMAGNTVYSLDFAGNTYATAFALDVDWTMGFSLVGTVLWAIDGRGAIAKVDAVTGDTLLTLSGPQSDYNTGLAISSDGTKLYIANYETNKLYVVKKADGSQIGSAALPYVGSSSGGVRGLCRAGAYFWLTDTTTQKIYKCTLSGE